MATSSGKEPVGYGTKMRAARLSTQQFEVLIEFMHQHPHFAVGRAAGGSCSKEEHDTLWKTLSATLNDTVGPMKSVTKWQKCWVDLKSNARSRAAKARQLTLDSPTLPAPVFTQWDEQVLRLLNDITGNENKYPTVVAQSPLQLVEVGFSEKLTPAVPNGHLPRVVKPKLVKSVPKSISRNQSENGYHIHENGVETGESVSPHGFNRTLDMHQDGNDIQELITNVKSEAEEEWLGDDGACEDDFSMEPIIIRNGPDSHPIRYLPTHNDLAAVEEEEFSVRATHYRSKKRKHDEPQIPPNFEDSLERLSTKICGTLERMAAAAEEANSIQQGMVNAMNRLASTFEQLVPVVAKVLSNNSNLTDSS